MTDHRTDQREWLEADGRGGFASGTVRGARTRRYHGLLLAATTPPTGRMMLVNGLEAWVTTPTGRVALTTQHYAPGVDHPDGASRLVAFSTDPWPTWTWDLGDGRQVVGEVVVTHGTSRVVCQWTLVGGGAASLEIQPLLSGRDYHALQHENPAFRFDTEARGAALVWRPYDGVPEVRCLTTGVFHPAATWFRQFLYTEERSRGLDAVEDLACPGTIHATFADGPVLCVFESGAEDVAPPCDEAGVRRMGRRWMAGERRRRQSLGSARARAVDAYIVTRGEGRSIIAGYPWFTDWGRDTFIAIRGLCLATGRLADARDILLAWAETVDRGMLPNRFPDAGGAAEFNAVDASLWFVVAAGELLALPTRTPRLVTRVQRARLQEAVGAILSGYAAGTRYRIRMDADGLLAAGEPGQQLTWMDARVGGREVTPRIGKPVEVQALWLNALAVGSAFDSRWAPLVERARPAFARAFWLDEQQMLCDVVDVDHEPGRVDATCRPNQIFAVGGLPLPLIAGAQARAVVDAVERALWTPMGLRSLSPDSAAYVGRYQGPPDARDGAYHQGTVWPWLLDAFVDAWLRVRGDHPAARAAADRRFVAPLRAHLAEAGLGHVSEVADGSAPHRPGGCPHQAWSLATLIRLEARVADAAEARGFNSRVEAGLHI
jgi:predicted glycogen debranching enzyme